MPLLPRTIADETALDSSVTNSVQGTNRTLGYISAGVIVAIILSGLIWVFFYSRRRLAKRRASEQTIELTPTSHRIGFGRGSQSQCSPKGKFGVLPDFKRRTSSGGTSVQYPLPLKVAEASRSLGLNV